MDAQALFSEIEPSLTGIAAKLGVSDPAGEARSWYARFADILAAFETGRLTREIYYDDGRIETFPENPSQEQIAAFRKSIKSYMKTSFKNDLIQAFNKRRVFVQIEDKEGQSLPAGFQLQTHIHSSVEEIIRLSDLIKIIESDCRRKKRSASVARDHVNYLFLLSLLKFYRRFMKSYGVMPIVRNLNAKDARDFFVFDIRDGRTEAVGVILQDLVSKESVKTVALCSRKLLSPEKGYFTLNRKISRYFNNVLGGMPVRLKKLRFGLVEENGDIDL